MSNATYPQNTARIYDAHTFLKTVRPRRQRCCFFTSSVAHLFLPHTGTPHRCPPGRTPWEQKRSGVSKPD